MTLYLSGSVLVGSANARPLSVGDDRAQIVIAVRPTSMTAAVCASVQECPPKGVALGWREPVDVVRSVAGTTIRLRVIRCPLDEGTPLFANLAEAASQMA